MTQVPAASLAEANETLYTSLTYGISLEQDRGDGRKSHTVRFLDFDKPNRNEWIVTRQYKVLGAKKHVIPDIVVFVNGLPLAVIECKSPTIGDTWKAEAVKQLHRYQEAGSRAGRTRGRRSCSKRRRFSSPPAASGPSTAPPEHRSGSSSNGRSRIP